MSKKIAFSNLIVILLISQIYAFSLASVVTEKGSNITD